jgi:hypothetical protein
MFLYGEQSCSVDEQEIITVDLSPLLRLKLRLRLSILVRVAVVPNYCG